MATRTSGGRPPEGAAGAAGDAAPVAMAAAATSSAASIRRIGRVRITSTSRDDSSLVEARYRTESCSCFPTTVSRAAARRAVREPGQPLEVQLVIERTDVLRVDLI